MSITPDVVWLNASPNLKCFDRPLIRHLSQYFAMAQWEHRCGQDEACSLENAVLLLHHFLRQRNHPVHLIGHGLSGCLGLLYARQYPEQVRSLTLLAVGVNPLIDWQAHYYAQRQSLYCSRYILLAQTVRWLFGPRVRVIVKDLVQVLERDLSASPSPHSLFQRHSFPAINVSVPLLVCGSRDDVVVDPSALHGWQGFLKPGDRLWECPSGYHFFHYFHPQLVGRQILRFWQSQTADPSIPSAQKLQNGRDCPKVAHLNRQSF